MIVVSYASALRAMGHAATSPERRLLTALGIGLVLAALPFLVRGTINIASKRASFQRRGSVQVRYDNFGTQRYSLDFNQPIVPGRLAVRVNAIKSEVENFKQRMGRDLEGYSYEQVERHYFPERYPFEPFGDPFAHDHDQSRRQRSDLRRKERMWTPGAAGPALTGQEKTTDEEPPVVPSEATTDEDGWSSGSSGGEEPQDDPKDEL
jgi:hypothetical protein